MVNTVLVVDDEQTLAGNIQAYLDAQGLNVHVAYDGVSAIGEAERTQPDVIVLDYRLPDMEGFQVLEAVRKNRNCHFVLITAHPTAEVRERANQLGVSHILFKPFPLAELARAVNDLMGIKRETGSEGNTDTGFVERRQSRSESFPCSCSTVVGSWQIADVKARGRRNQTTINCSPGNNARANLNMACRAPRWRASHGNRVARCCLHPGMRPRSLGRELLAQARATAEQSAERLLDTLQRLSGLSPAEFVCRLGATLHYPVLDSQALFAATPLFDRVSLAQCLKREFLFLEHDGQALGVFADPFDTARLAWIDECLQGAPLYLVEAADLAGFLARHEESFNAVDSLDTESEAVNELDTLQSLSLASISEDQSRVVKLVNSTLYDALKMHASDIHLGVTGTGLVIKYRIDGVLNSISKVSGSEFAEQVISRIKVMAELDIGEKRVPSGRSLQDRYQRPPDRLSCIDHAEHFRRRRGAAGARQTGPGRSRQRRPAASPGL